MKRLKRHSHNIVFIIGSVVFMGVLLLGITSGRAYLFSSRAEEDNTSVVYTQSSTSIMSAELNSESCVDSLNYLPDLRDTTLTCYAEFVCNGETNNIQKENCIRTSEIIKEAEKLCGCSE